MSIQPIARICCTLAVIAAGMSLAGPPASAATSPAAGDHVFTARLADGGAPADGTYDVLVEIWDAAEGGAVIERWTELVVEVEAGRLMIPLPSDLAPPGDLWLELAVRDAGRGDFEALPSRHPLGPKGGGQVCTVNGALQVTGQIEGGLAVQAPVMSIGEDGDYVRMVRGEVAANGSVVSGDGFTAQRMAPGVYRVTFDSAFNEAPTVVATAKSSAWNTNVTVTSWSASEFWVATTRTVTDVQDDHIWGFVAFGPRLLIAPP